MYSERVLDHNSSSHRRDSNPYSQRHIVTIVRHRYHLCLGCCLGEVLQLLLLRARAVRWSQRNDHSTIKALPSSTKTNFDWAWSQSKSSPNFKRIGCSRRISKSGWSRSARNFVSINRIILVEIEFSPISISLDLDFEP